MASKANGDDFLLFVDMGLTRPGEPGEVPVSVLG